MKSDEQTKKLLLLAYHVATLYVDASASANDVNVATNISLPTIKRYLKMISEKKGDYRRLLPQLLDEAELDSLAEKIEEQSNGNKKLNRWKGELDLSDYTSKIKMIKELHSELPKPKLEEEDIRTIKNLRISDETLSIRKIHDITGFSLAAIQNVLNPKPSAERSKGK